MTLLKEDLGARTPGAKFSISGEDKVKFADGSGLTEPLPTSWPWVFGSRSNNADAGNTGSKGMQDCGCG